MAESGKEEKAVRMSVKSLLIMIVLADVSIIIYTL